MTTKELLVVDICHVFIHDMCRGGPPSLIIKLSNSASSSISNYNSTAR